MSSSKTPAPLPPVLLGDIKTLIEEGRRQAAMAVNMGLTLLYWRVGQRINAEILQDERAAYGEQIVSALSRQLSWSHFLEIIYQKDPLKPDFYAEMCRIERWSVRALRERMGTMLFERTAIARQPDALIRQELDTLHAAQAVTTPLVLKAPYLLDFLGLQDRHLEKDLEDAILRELENFLLELGAGFSFVARQKSIQVDNDDFYIDLLLYNRKLKRLVSIDLKLDDFRAEHKGQMELYLRWLAKHETESGEAPPLGSILCTGKKQEQIELLELDASGIHVRSDAQQIETAIVYSVNCPPPTTPAETTTPAASTGCPASPRHSCACSSHASAAPALCS